MDLLWYRVSLRLSCAVAFSSWAWASSARPCGGSGWRLLLAQPGQPAAGDALEALTELLLGLHQRRAGQHEHGVLLRQAAARDLDVVLVGEPGPHWYRYRHPVAQREHDVIPRKI